MVSLSSSSSQFSIDTVFANGGSKLLTEDDICDIISKKIATSRSSSANESGLSHKRVIGSLFQADCNVPSSSSDVIPKCSPSLKVCLYKHNVNSAAIQECTPKSAQAPGDLLKIIKAELTSKKIETKDCPQVQTEVAATNVTKEVLSTISAGRCEEGTETHSGLTRSCILSQEHKSQLNSNKNLGNGDLIPGVSVELVMQKRVKNPGNNNVEEMDSVQDINSNSTEDQHGHITRKEKQLCMILKDPQYEDISDDEDKSKLLSSELYEDVSEDENQCNQRFAVEIPPHPVLSEPTPGNSSTRLDVPKIKNLIPETETRCCCSPLVQTEHQLCLKGDHEPNTSCAVFKGKQELDNQLDDDDDNNDDDWRVLPVTILNLKFEEADDGECGGKTSLSFINERFSRPAPKPVPASAFSQMEVFDTPAHQEQAVRFGQVSFVVPSSCSNRQQESHIVGSRQEAEDGCETDDGCDYSSGSESNYLTASNQVAGNLSSSSQIIIVDSDSEGKNQGHQAKNFQKSSNQDIIVYIDSDDESDDHVEETKRCCPLTENCGTSPANKPEPLESLCENSEKMSLALDLATLQLQGGLTESTELSQGTEKGLCVINDISRPTNSDDGIIIILSDSDDDSVELCNEAMTSTLNSLNSDFWLKKHTANKKILQDLNQFSVESYDSRTDSSWDKPGTSILIPPAKLSFHQPSEEVKDLTKKRILSSETEEEKDDNDDYLNNAGNGVCTKRMKVKLSKTSGSFGPVIPRLLVQVSPLSTEQIQLLHESTVQSWDKEFPSTSSTVSSHNDSFRKKSRHSIRDETGKLTFRSKRTKQVHNPMWFKVSQASSLKGQVRYSRPSESCPPFLLRRSSSSSASTPSEEQTNHARKKVFSDWQKNHVPLRRERKATRRGKLP